MILEEEYKNNEKVMAKIGVIFVGRTEPITEEDKPSVFKIFKLFRDSGIDNDTLVSWAIRFEQLGVPTETLRSLLY